MNNIEEIRREFPILQRTVYGKPLIYFDNGATTQKPWRVIHKLEEGYTLNNSNIHRGVHHLSQVATAAHEEARATVARFLDAESAKEVLFVRGTTEAINLVASSLPSLWQGPSEVIVTEMEHHSNIVPWQLAAARFGFELKVAPITEEGALDMVAMAALMNERTRLVAVTHVSNVLGTINPIGEIVRLGHAVGALVLVDGAQSVAHIPVSVRQLDIDFFAFSGHKAYAPNGVGVLYGKEALLNAMPPYQGGGEMIDRVSFAGTTFNELPFKFEAGTPDYVGSTALAEALRYLQEQGLEEVAAYEHELLEYATARLLEALPSARIMGTAQPKSAVLSFLVGDIHPFDLGTLLDRQGIAVRTGHHCAQPLMERLGIEGTVRASFAFYNTKQEIDAFVEAVVKAVRMLL